MIDFRKTQTLTLTLCLAGMLVLIGCDQDDRSPVAPQVDPPQLTIENPTFDFGYTSQFSFVSRTIWLKSTGGSPVKIVHISSG